MAAFLDRCLARIPVDEDAGHVFAYRVMAAFGDGCGVLVCVRELMTAAC